jgi:hypothetical protein
MCVVRETEAEKVDMRESSWEERISLVEGEMSSCTRLKSEGWP